MNVRRTLVSILVLSLVAACQSPSALPAEQARLRERDEQWSASVSQRDPETIVSFWTRDAKVYPPGGSVISGREALLQFVGQMLAIPGFSISWEPRDVVVDPDGAHGYTTGVIHSTAPGPNGAPTKTSGRYVTIWRKGADGVWRCAIDMWNDGPTE
jgi:ketosteroid isomerase-like protein